MTLSIKKQERVQKYREWASEIRKNLPYRLNEEQFKKLLIQFYAESEKHGFYLRLEDAIRNRGFFFTDHQRAIAVDILKSIFTKSPSVINISITRQFGKTELVTMVISFCYDHFFKAFGEPFKCCVIAPEKGTASEVFNRACRYIMSRGIEMITNTREEKETIRGDVIRLFGIYDDVKGGTIEGRTHNLVVRDEAHLGDDEKFADQVEPTTVRTDGSIVMIGNGGFGSCSFRENIKKGNTPLIGLSGQNVGENIVHRYTYRTLKPYMEDLANKGLQSASSWIRGIEKYISARGGMESYNVMKNVLCEWIVSFGNFLTEEQLAKCERRTPRLPITEYRDLYLGVDFAFKGDRTVAAFINRDRQIEDWVVLKDANEIRTLKEQCEELYYYCEEKGILRRIAGIGGDATGMGQGAVEFLEDYFDCEIVPYVFTFRSKHEWYLNMRDLMMTNNNDDRIWYDPAHPHANKFKKEMIELDVTILKNGYLSFSAPNKQDHYDDFVAATAIANSMRANELYMYYKKREVDEKQENYELKEQMRRQKEKFLGKRIKTHENNQFFKDFSSTASSMY